MDKLDSTNNGGMPLELDDLRWALGQESTSKAIYQALNYLLKMYGNNIILYGCEFTATPVAAAPVTEGLVLLDSELLFVDAHTVDLTASEGYAQKVTTYDSIGQETFRDGSTVDTYEKNRCNFNATSGTIDINSNRDDYLFTELIRADILDAIRNDSNFAATTGLRGSVETATAAEVQAGTDFFRYVTPSTLKLSKIIDRGDPSSADYTKTDFTFDASWHTLDLSAILPSWARFVLLRLIITPDNTAQGDGGTLLFREYGNSNALNVSGGYCVNEAAGGVVQPISNDCWVPCDASQRLEYQGVENGNGINTVNVTVAMYM